MSRTQTASPQPHADREQEIRHAEQDLGAAESQMAQELARLEAAAGELRGRLQQVKAAAARAHLSGIRVGGGEIPALDVSGPRDEALRARIEAVQARRAALEKLRQRVHAHSAELGRISAQLSSDEAAIARFEAQAREEAARKAQLEAQAVAAPPQRAAPAPVPPPPARAKPQPRRALPRVRMQAAVDLHSESNFFTGFSTNLSEGGLFIATVQSVPIGTEVDLSFSLGDGQKLTVQGVVRWIRVVNDQTPDIFPGVGIQFVSLDPATASAIQRFVAAREPMFFPE